MKTKKIKLPPPAYEITPTSDGRWTWVLWQYTKVGWIPLAGSARSIKDKKAAIAEVELFRNLAGGAKWRVPKQPRTRDFWKARERAKRRGL